MQTEKIIDTKKEISDLKENIPNNQKIDLGELPPPPKFEEKKKVGFLSKIMGTKEKKSPSKIDKLPLPPVPGNEEPNLTGLNDMPDPLAPSAMTIPEPPVMHEDNNQQLNTELEKQVIAKEDSKSSFSMPEPPSFSNDSKVEELNMPGLKSENINKNPSSIPPPPSFSIDMKKEEPIKPFEKLDSDLKKLDVVSKEAISIPHPPSAPKSKESKPKKGLFGGLLGKKKKDVKNLDLKTEIKKEDVTKKNDLSLPPSFDKKESFDFKPPKLEEPKSISLPPEEKIGDLPKPPVFDVEMSPTSEFEVLATDKKEEIVDKKVEVKSLIDEDKEINDLLAKMKKESADFKDEDSVDFGTKLESELVQEVTPLHEVPGIGQKRKDELESVGIGSAEVLADTHEDHIVEKTNIPRAHAKKIIKHAKKIKKKTSRRKKVATHKKVSVHKKKKSANKEQSISELIKELEAEKSELKKIEKSSADIPDIKGHEKIILLLEQLEKKKMELIIYEKELETNKSKLDSHKGKYSRDYANLEQLRRRLDHDIRERTQYLIDLERDFYKKGQDLAKRESVIKIQEGEIKNKIDSFKDTEKKLRKLENTLHDREITTKTKEQKLNSILMELDKKEDILNKKDDRLETMEKSYEKRLEILKNHEKDAHKELDSKKKELEKKFKGLQTKEKSLSKKQKVIDIEDRALDYAESEIEMERKKLEEDEFQQYLHEKIGMIKETNIEIQNIEHAKSIHVPDLKDNHKHSIHDDLDTCRKMVKQGRSTEAKVFYNKARDKYYTLKFHSHEDKENMHNVMRELYDDINLIGL